MREQLEMFHTQKDANREQLEKLPRQLIASVWQLV